VKNGLSRLNWRPIRGAIDAVASVLFPAPCRVCREPLATASRVPVCPECLGSLRRIVPPVCGACGRPFPPVMAASVSPVCHACLRRAYRFDLARSFAYYDEKMVRLLTLLKYEPARPLANWFAARLEEVVLAEPKLAEVDCVLPVPLDRTRLRERGYNQAELIARPLARRLNRPISTDVLPSASPPAKIEAEPPRALGYRSWRIRGPGRRPS
jgi:predicted amidophosphoribosyltransferase